MSPFGLFDLLKTLLPQPTPTNSPANASETETQSSASANPPVNAAASSNTPQQNADFSTENAAKTNACADFLYRHERLSQNMKHTKKRSD